MFLKFLKLLGTSRSRLVMVGSRGAQRADGATDITIKRWLAIPCGLVCHLSMICAIGLPSLPYLTLPHLSLP
jgi:hypothetical protein